MLLIVKRNFSTQKSYIEFTIYIHRCLSQVANLLVKALEIVYQPQVPLMEALLRMARYLLPRVNKQIPRQPLSLQIHIFPPI